MPDTTRTFLGIGISPLLAPKLERMQGLLEHLAPGVRWIAARPFHITLAFLGEVAHPDLNAVCKIADNTAGRFAPFDLQLEALGAFPNPAKARVIWAGVGALGLDFLFALQADLYQGLATIDQATDHSPFRPHVTLGRLKPRKGSETDMTAPLSRYKGWNTPTFKVNEIVTFGSTLGPDGSVYSTLGRARLSAAKPRAGA